MEHGRLCAVWPMENWYGSSLNQIHGWTTVRESHSRALKQGLLAVIGLQSCLMNFDSNTKFPTSFGLTFRDVGLLSRRPHRINASESSTRIDILYLKALDGGMRFSLKYLLHQINLNNWWVNHKVAICKWQTFTYRADGVDVTPEMERN